MGNTVRLWIHERKPDQVHAPSPGSNPALIRILEAKISRHFASRNISVLTCFSIDDTNVYKLLSYPAISRAVASCWLHLRSMRLASAGCLFFNATRTHRLSYIYCRHQVHIALVHRCWTGHPILWLTKAYGALRLGPHPSIFPRHFFWNAMSPVPQAPHQQPKSLTFLDARQRSKTRRIYIPLE